MEKNSSVSPYRQLGKKLKSLRVQARETLAEASGAVEIEVRQLASYELGQSRPNEEVLLLLISHFGADDSEAVKLWELAGFNMVKIPASHLATEGADAAVAEIKEEPRILFTDTVDVVVNNYGVVMNFKQNAGGKTVPVTVARVGMSRDHAKSVLQILQLTLSQTEKRGLKLPKASLNSEAEDQQISADT